MTLPIIGSLYRCSGLFNEPSLYAAFILCLVFLLFHFQNKIGKIGFFAILSIFLTFALAGMLSGALLCFAVFYKKYNQFSIRTIILTSMFVSLIPLFYLASERVDRTNFSPIAIRINLINEVFNQEPLEIILGNGPMGVPTKLARFTSGDVMVDNELASFPDAGAWLFIIMKFGLLSLVVYIFFTFKMLTSWNHGLVFFSILLTKMNFLYLFFVVFSLLVILVKNKKY
jgi:hypothetical protein